MTISSGLSRYSNNPTTTLNGAINNVVTTIVVTSSVGFPNPGPFRIIIDNEQMQVTAGWGTTSWTVVRGTDGTAGASHLNAAPVTNNITAFDYQSYRSEFNPMSYSAVGDGIADDSTPFQNAVNDAHAMTNGGHIFLPDLPFKVISTLTTYANVVFITYGAVLSGAGASSVTPLIRYSQLGGLTLPAAFVISSGGANITGGLTVASGNFSTTGTTTFNTKAYTWPGTYGSNGQVLTSNGAGTLSWSASGGVVSSVSGTTNQVTVSPTTGATVVSLPSGGTLPGSWTAASGFTVTTGGLTVSAGGLTVSANGITVTGGITGTISTGAQPNITSLGTLSSLILSDNASNTMPTLGSGTGTSNGVQVWITSTDPAASAGEGDLWVQG